MKNVKIVFEEHCPHLVFDQKLLKAVSVYEQQFVNKNIAHISFFGGNLMGVDPVRFKDEDRTKWFQEVMDADEDAIKDDLHALTAIEPHRHVSSDAMNLSCFWMAHGFMTSDKLNEEDRHRGALCCIQILQYKFITSILAEWFKWDADPIVAQATYTQLTKRFGIKAYGSWGALLRARAEDVIAKNSIHYKALMSFTDDFKIVYMANDTQGRIKDILKNIRDVFTTVLNSPELQIKNISSTIELDGELKIRDKTRLISQYMSYLLEIINDKNGFIVKELVDVIVKTVPTMPRSALISTLTYMSANASPKADKRVQRVCELTLQHAFDYLTRNPTTMSSQSDIPGLIRKMRSLYQASRTSNPMILEMRTLTEEIVAQAIRSKNKVLIPAVRNAVLLYLLLRSFTMNKFRR